MTGDSNKETSQRSKDALLRVVSWLADHSLILWGQVKMPLLTRLRFTVLSILSAVATLRMIFAAPLQSALIYLNFPL